MPRSSAGDLHGILPVDKPAGWTSHDVVARLRRLTGTRRIGHAGTLDPFATGALVVAAGRATRLLRYIQTSQKRYLAHIVLGVETDTHDVDGEITHRLDDPSWPSAHDVARVASRFTGTIEQVPPAHSAIRVGGERLYERARAGEHVDVPTRTVEIAELNVLEYRPPDILVDIRCSTGTYIRSIARDVGAELGTGAYCHGLRRTEVGLFTLDRCWSLDELASADLRDNWPLIAESPDAGLAGLQAVVLGQEESRAWYHGRLIRNLLDSPSGDVTVRVYTSSGIFAGLGQVSGDGHLKPEIVFKID